MKAALAQAIEHLKQTPCHRYPGQAVSADDPLERCIDIYFPASIEFRLDTTLCLAFATLINRETGHASPS